MKNTISFSVILPTWNRASFICKAIDSLLAQTFQKFELLIVDDGSVDGTELLIRSRYSEELESGRFCYLAVPHGGLSYARNIGLRHARNEWIVYLDSDNMMDPHFLEEYAKRISETSAQCYYAKFRNREKGTVVGQAFSRELLEKGNYIDIGVFVHHISRFIDFGGFDEQLRRLEDWDVILKYTKHTPPCFIDEVLLDYDDAYRADRLSIAEDHDTAYRYIIEKHALQVH